MSTRVADVCADGLDLRSMIPDTDAAAALPEAVARRLHVVPLALLDRKQGRCLIVATDEPDDSARQESIIRQTLGNFECELRKAPTAQIPAAITRCYRFNESLQMMLAECRTDADLDDVIRTEPEFIVRLLERVLEDAWRRGASDIHWSPEQSALQLRYRVDGVLRPIAQLTLNILSGLLVRVKILCGMDIAESRHAQDGEFVQLIQANSCSFRVSTFPTVQGESIVIRILGGHYQALSLCALQLPAAVHMAFQSLIMQPEGLVILCGPTGSGKSTTLHTILSEHDSECMNIMTLEDPVEQRLAGVRQTTVSTQSGMGFVDGLRSMLRQDPDVIMLGEIRDPAGCAVVFSAVMSGHKVLSTVHARSVTGAIDRLLELGASRSEIANHTLAIASQRLFRLVCNACLCSNTDCVSCQGSGYRGRRAAIELLPISGSIAQLIREGADYDLLLLEANRLGYPSLAEQARDWVELGITDNEEVSRVLGEAGMAQRTMDLELKNIPAD